MLLGEMKGYLYWFKNTILPRTILSKISFIFGCAIRIPAWTVWGDGTWSSPISKSCHC